MTVNRNLAKALNLENGCSLVQFSTAAEITCKP
ncbi:MAG: hypothetical protein ACI9HU_000875, partial [Colwellia sp.]